jgi:hypothetical protein
MRYGGDGCELSRQQKQSCITFFMLWSSENVSSIIPRDVLPTYQSTRCHNPEDIMNFYRYESLWSHIALFCFRKVSSIRPGDTVVRVLAFYSKDSDFDSNRRHQAFEVKGNKSVCIVITNRLKAGVESTAETICMLFIFLKFSIFQHNLV